VRFQGYVTKPDMAMNRCEICAAESLTSSVVCVECQLIAVSEQPSEGCMEGCAWPAIAFGQLLGAGALGRPALLGRPLTGGHTARAGTPVVTRASSSARRSSVHRPRTPEGAKCCTATTFTTTTARRIYVTGGRARTCSTAAPDARAMTMSRWDSCRYRAAVRQGDRRD
jgi:hypothetical protein